PSCASYRRATDASTSSDRYKPNGDVARAPPIALGTGASAAARRPLGRAVVGGFLVSQLLALYITPVLYLYMESAQKYLAEHPISQVFFWPRGRAPGHRSGNAMPGVTTTARRSTSCKDVGGRFGGA